MFKVPLHIIKPLIKESLLVQYPVFVFLGFFLVFCLFIFCSFQLLERSFVPLSPMQVYVFSSTVVSVVGHLRD